MTATARAISSPTGCPVWTCASSRRPPGPPSPATATPRSGPSTLYRGELAEGWDFAWAEADRERLRLLLLNTISRYAEACRAAGDLAAAESAIDRALAIDRYSEPLYRDLMALHRQQGREDAVRRDYARVEGALAEIGMKPEPRTSALLNGDEPVRP